MRGTILISFFVGLFSHLQSQTLTLNFAGLRNSSGNIQVQFFDSNQGFDKEKPLFVKWVSKKMVVNGQLSITYMGIKPGTYGIAVLDDENSNKKMDYGLVLPKEGFGFSDYYHSGMTRPSFTDFKFVLANEKKTVTVKMRYL